MFCAPSRASPQEGIRTTQHHLLTPKGWRARALEALVLRAGRAQCERVEQKRPVNARGQRSTAAKNSYLDSYLDRTDYLQIAQSEDSLSYPGLSSKIAHR